MRKTLAVSAVALSSLFFTGSAFAQDMPAPPQEGAPAPAAPTADSGDDDDKKIGLGGDLLFMLPLGDFADASGPLVGPVLRAGYRVMPPLEVTLRLGYLLNFGKDAGGATLKTNILPIWAGARYFFMEPHAGLYGAAELGVNMLFPSVSPEIPGVTLDTQTRFGFNLGAGYVISKELPIDFRLQLSHLNLIGTETNEKAAIGLGLSAGYTFQL
jgi:hypothetical protein